MEVMYAVRLRIRQLQTERALSVNGLAALCGINQSTLQQIVSGERTTTSIATIQKVCDGLEMDMSDFFEANVFRELV